MYFIPHFHDTCHAHTKICMIKTGMSSIGESECMSVYCPLKEVCPHCLTWPIAPTVGTNHKQNKMKEALERKWELAVSLHYKDKKHSSKFYTSCSTWIIIKLQVMIMKTQRTQLMQIRSTLFNGQLWWHLHHLRNSCPSVAQRFMIFYFKT